MELKQMSTIFGCYSKSFKDYSPTWTAAYQRNRKDFSFLLIRQQLSISDAGCHRGGQEVNWNGRFLTAAVITLSHVRRRSRATDTLLLRLKREKFSLGGAL